MRIRSIALAVSAAVTIPAVASVAFAPAAFATKGDNGTVKIHDAKTGKELRRNEPHVCQFYLDAFGFDASQDVTWKIKVWPPSKPKGKTVKSGAFDLDAQGHGRTGDMTLSDGHYKLVWNFKGEKGRAKHKVFWTDCKDDGRNTPPSHKPSEKDSEKSSGESAKRSSGESAKQSSDQASDTSNDGAAAKAASDPSATPQGGTANLAETGAGTSLGLMAAGAAVLVGGGVVLIRRLGSARRH